MTDVIIAGGGPTGMMLAAELTLAGVDVAIVEQRSTPRFALSRGGGFHSRTIEILDQRGVADRFLAEGQIAPSEPTRDVSDFPTRHPYSLGLWQNHIERIMADWIDELAVPIHREREVSGFTQDDTGVDVHLADGDTLRATYLVGADGGRSVIRKAAGIAFPGLDPTRSAMIAQAEMAEEPEMGMRQDARGAHGISRVDYEVRDGQVVFADSGPVRIMVSEKEIGPATEPTLDDLSQALKEIYGTDFGLHSATWISRFTDASRQAAAYRAGRVLLAGDAAHIHHPWGGQGIGFGIQDAVNLGWKLAQVVRSVSPDSLLDTYQNERHPVQARAMQHIVAQGVLLWPDERIAVLRGLMTELMGMEESRKHVVGIVSGLDVHYDLGAGHPLLGRRMPDLDLDTTDGALRVFTLLHDARPVLINLGEPGSIDIGPWKDRVQLVDASYDGPWELPVIGDVTAPPAVLVRPDGHVAWVGDGSQSGLADALATWFGPAAG